MADTSKNVEMTSLASDHPETKVFTCLGSEVQFGLPAARYDKWAKDAQKRKENHTFEERRIGWILPKPNYKVVCCGQSWGDLCNYVCGLMMLVFILFLMLVFYGVNALIVVILWNITSLDFVVVS